MVTQKLTIRLDETELPEIRMVSGDIGREIQIEVYAREDSENPIDLESYSAEITLIKPDNTFIMNNFTVDKYELPENAGAVSGKGYYQIKIFTAGTHQIYTGQGPFLVDDMILSDDVIESSSIAFGDRFPEDFATKTWVDEEIEHAGLGIYVEGNPAGDPTEPDLTKLQINDAIFPIPQPIVPDTLDDLDDVDITAPAGGDVLMYDDVEDKWVNESLPDPLHVYSTTEQVIGKWVDGSDVKEKTYIYTGTGAANPFSTTIDMTGKSIIEVIPHYAKFTYGGGIVGYCAGSKLTESNSAILKVEYDDATPPTVNVSSYLGSSTETYEIAFTIRYI